MLPNTRHTPPSITAISQLQHLLADPLAQLNGELQQQFNSSVPLIPEMANYLMAGGGKRLRPLLTLAMAGIYHAPAAPSVALASAVELIHSATLLHDDVIDNSDLRRGRACANRVWGNQAAVLVGDFMFARAFQAMVRANNGAVLDILAKAAARITEGELLQLQHSGSLDISNETHTAILDGKTAALFAAACEVIPVLCQRPPEEIDAAHRYGLYLGRAFQLVDDILDYSASAAQLGKEPGDDFREGKITLPVLWAWHECSQRNPDQQKAELIQRVMQPEQQQGDDFNRLKNMLLDMGAFAAAKHEARSAIGHAKQALALLPNHAITSLLAELAEESLERLQ